MSVFYSKDHEWIDISGGVGTVGITEYAVHQLGDITFVDLPGVGKGFKQFGVICSVESVKAVSDIFSPVSGEVSAVNNALNGKPELLNESAEKDGWIFKIKLTDEKETAALMNKSQYDEYLKGL